MKKKLTSPFRFFNCRGPAAWFFVSVAVPMALYAFGVFPTASAIAQNQNPDVAKAFQASAGEHAAWSADARTGLTAEPVFPQPSRDVAAPSGVAAATRPAAAGMVITPTFDSSITGNPNAAAIQAMINQAIAIYQAQFSDPINVQIYFRYSSTQPNGSPMGTALARSNFVIYTIAWSTYIAALQADARTGNDTTANGSLPASPLSANVIPSSAGGRAVGLNTAPAMFANGTVGAGGPYDGIVTLNSSQPFQFSRPPTGNNYDALRSTEHEMDEVLGLGSFINSGANVRPQDLFSWSAPGSRNITSTGSRYFSINSGTTNIVGFSQDPGGDFGDWISLPCPQANPYVQNAFSCPAQFSDVTATSPEGINLDVIGYDLATGPTPTPSPTPCTVLSERFDGVTAPALPAGWVATNTQGPGPLWVTSTVVPDTAPNDAFVDDPSTVSDKLLDTPGIAISSATAQVSFRNFYNTESNFDGAVLEVSSPNINGGTFTDITDAAVGGSFVAGGYNSTISTAFMSPIAGRMAWSGSAGGYSNTLANLGPNVAGRTIKLRFRMASDNSVSAMGWRIDTIAVMDGGCSSPTLGNISTRLRVETGNNVLIGGFIITGTQPKKIIVRAIGPSLTLAGVLANPFLELRNSGGGLIASNDNWRSDQQAEIIATGIPPSNDLESAIVATLPANNSAYTVVVRGVNNGTGVGVVEAYDLDRTVDSKLANISTRGLVQTGDNVMIGGLIVLGQSQLRIIVRAIGPSLPVAGALGNPTLELRDGNGALIAANDNWRSDQEAEIVATGIPPSNDLESAIVRNLTPGNYTAIVRGVNGATGVALVEAYGLN